MKVVVPVVRTPAEAVIVIEPASDAGDGLGGDAGRGGAVPGPVTVPVPLVLAKVTEVALSAVRTLLLASRTSAVTSRVVPEVRLPSSW